MPYGTPSVDPFSRTYKVVLNHQTLAAGDLVCTLNFGDVTEADSDQFVQEFVDLIDGSTDFVLGEAKKTMPSTETITPT